MAESASAAQTQEAIHGTKLIMNENGPHKEASVRQQNTKVRNFQTLPASGLVACIEPVIATIVDAKIARPLNTTIRMFSIVYF